MTLIAISRAPASLDSYCQPLLRIASRKCFEMQRASNLLRIFRKASHLEFFGPMRTQRWRDCRPAISWKKVTGTWKVVADIFNTDNQIEAIGGESTRFGGRDEDEYLAETALVSWVRTPLQT